MESRESVDEKESCGPLVMSQTSPNGALTFGYSA